MRRNFRMPDESERERSEAAAESSKRELPRAEHEPQPLESWRRLRRGGRSRGLLSFAFLFLVRFLCCFAPFFRARLFLGWRCRFHDLLVDWRLRWFPGGGGLFCCRVEFPTLHLTLSCIARSSCSFGPRGRSGGFRSAGPARLV